MINDTLGDASRRVVDGAAALVAGGTLAGILPHVAALFTVIWYVLQVYETKTIQRWRRRRRIARRAAAARTLRANKAARVGK